MPQGFRSTTFLPSNACATGWSARGTWWRGAQSCICKGRRLAGYRVRRSRLSTVSQWRRRMTLTSAVSLPFGPRPKSFHDPSDLPFPV